MLGKVGAPYHFEFTHAHGHAAGRAPTPDNLLILYVPDVEEWKAAVQRMRDAGFNPVPAFNPYWDRDGLTFEDPDGYRIVVQRGEWTYSGDSKEECSKPTVMSMRGNSNLRRLPNLSVRGWM
jgi:Glyoxalase/Bleomycin resistance protein/Dioxygenase superfamily